MQSSSNRSIVIISGLLTLLVLGAATLAVAFRNGWVHVPSAAPSREAVTARAQSTDADGDRTVPPPREADVSAVPGADADQSEIAVSRRKLEDAYRALDEAYAQIRSLQTAQAQVASRAGDDRGSAEHDDDRPERRPRHRESDDD